MAAVSPPRELQIEPVEATRTFETAINHIVEAVDGAHLRNGDRLPNEGELAEALGISKPTLRQALRVLKRAEMVEVRRGAGGGIFLTADLIPVELISEYVAVEEHQVVDLLMARRVLETGVTNLAAERANDDDFAAIERTNRLLEQHIGDRPLVMRADAAFHRAVSRASHSRALQASMRLLSREIEPVRDAYRGGEEYDGLTLNVHSRQLDAMRRRDHAALSELLDLHFSMLEECFAEGIGQTWETLFAGPAAEAAAAAAAPAA
jgi:GntR family transcriptional regulator, transcriptional repressor for pyruvate dehydrogenase complex